MRNRVGCKIREGEITRGRETSGDDGDWVGHPFEIYSEKFYFLLYSLLVLYSNTYMPFFPSTFPLFPFCFHIICTSPPCPLQMEIVLLKNLNNSRNVMFSHQFTSKHTDKKALSLKNASSHYRFFFCFISTFLLLFFLRFIGSLLFLSSQWLIGTSTSRILSFCL